MENFMGVCQYCGQETGVIAESQIIANQLVTESCNCKMAGKVRKKEKLKEALQELAGENCEEMGFSQVESVVYDAIETIGCMAVDGLLQAASIKVDGTVITIKGGEKTKLTRKFTYEKTGEIE